MTGKTYGQWFVIEFSENKTLKSGVKKPFWKCRCSCGTERDVDGASLRNGLSHGCGCTKGEAISKARTKHGHNKPGIKISPTYWSWTAMRARILGNGASGKKYYQSKGITICERWNSFSNFLEDMGERPEGCSIDRIDYNGNYEPENCRWATDEVQANNKSSNVFLIFEGKTQTVGQWAKELGIPRSSLVWHIKKHGNDLSKFLILVK